MHDPVDIGSVLILPWIPRTSAAVALRLCEVDASIYYIGCERPEPEQDNEMGGHMVSDFSFIAYCRHHRVYDDVS